MFVGRLVFFNEKVTSFQAKMKCGSLTFSAVFFIVVTLRFVFFLLDIGLVNIRSRSFVVALAAAAPVFSFMLVCSYSSIAVGHSLILSILFIYLFFPQLLMARLSVGMKN